MTIKKTIKQIDSNLEQVYTELQKLEYEQEIENNIRRDLGNILIITLDLLNFIDSYKEKQKR